MCDLVELEHGLMDMPRALNSFGGVASRQELLGRGCTDAQIRRAVREGMAITDQPGVFYRPGADLLFRQAYDLKGVLTCVSAAPYYGLWRLHEHPELHLYCTNGLARREGRIKAAGLTMTNGAVKSNSPARANGRTGGGNPGGVTNDGGIPAVLHRRLLLPRDRNRPVAALADVLLHAMRCLPRFEALSMVQCAVARGDITVGFLRERLPGNRNGQARALLDLVGPRADSLLEPIARVLFREAGFLTESYVPLPGVGEVDFLLEGFLVVEIDGGTHFEPKSIKKDRRRDNASVVGGYLVLRYFYEDVVYEPERMLAEVAAVLRRGRGWRP